ncbi:unnamed protein product, partial [Oppiella nova]
MFRKNLILSVLTERRVYSPYGMKGGEPGKRGKNLLKFHRNGRTVDLGAKNSVPTKNIQFFYNDNFGDTWDQLTKNIQFFYNDNFGDTWDQLVVFIWI